MHVEVRREGGGPGPPGASAQQEARSQWPAHDVDSFARDPLELYPTSAKVVMVADSDMLRNPGQRGRWRISPIKQSFARSAARLLTDCRVDENRQERLAGARSAAALDPAFRARRCASATPCVAATSRLDYFDPRRQSLPLRLGV
jgi:hypothetical protein